VDTCSTSRNTPELGSELYPGTYAARAAVTAHSPTCSAISATRRDPLQDLLVLLVFDLLRLHPRSDPLPRIAIRAHARMPGGLGRSGTEILTGVLEGQGATRQGQGPSARLACGPTFQGDTGVGGQPPRSFRHTPAPRETAEPAPALAAARQPAPPACGGNWPGFSRRRGVLEGTPWLACHASDELCLKSPRTRLPHQCGSRLLPWPCGQ
jgi:hypothetical protein